MNTKSLISRFLCLFLVLILAACGGKDDDNNSTAKTSLTSITQPTHELIRMLSITPAEAAKGSADGRLEIQYADLRANEQARPGVPTPTDSADFIEQDSRLWLVNEQRLIAVAPDLNPIVAFFDAEFVNYYGFDIFEIDRSLYFGPPPYSGVIYGGHFDSDQIVQTLAARTYTTTELNGIQVLCGPVGCERGWDTGNPMPDATERDPKTLKIKGQYNILGGRLFQQLPIALPPGYMFTAPDWDTVGEMTALAADGTGDSLYEVPEYRTIADFAVSGDPLIQVLFFPPAFFLDSNFVELLMERGMSAEDAAAVAEKYGLSADSENPSIVEDLSPYTLGAIVDQQDGSDQLHSIVLVYSSEADAQQAADEVLKRIPLQNGLLEFNDPTPFVELVAPGYSLDPPQVVHNSKANRWLAVATVRVPLPSNEPDAEDGRITPSGRLLAVWFRSWMTRNFTPVQLPQPAE